MSLLDSNIVIYTVQPGFEWLREAALTESAGVSVTTVVEVLGYQHLSSESEADLREILRCVKVFPVDMVVAERAILLRQQKRMSLGDSLIAATAIVYGFKLITRNVRDFHGIEGLTLINPFDGRPGG